MQVIDHGCGSLHICTCSIQKKMLKLHVNRVDSTAWLETRFAQQCVGPKQSKGHAVLAGAHSDAVVLGFKVRQETKYRPTFIS